MEKFLSKIIAVAKMSDAVVMTEALALQTLIQEGEFTGQEKLEQELYLDFLKEVLKARKLLDKTYYKL